MSLSYKVSPQTNLAIHDMEPKETELECKRLLFLRKQSYLPEDKTDATLLRILAQAQEAQDKLAEGLETRLHAQEILSSLIHSKGY